MLEDKEKHLKFRIWVSVICMVCLCGCSSYDDPDGDIIFHYLEHMTLAVKQNKGTYHIEITEVTMA